MATAYCPQCGSPRTGQLRYCASCAYDFWKAAEAAGQGQLGAAPIRVAPAPQGVIPPPKTGRSMATIVVVVLIVVGVLGGAYYLIRQNANDIVDRVSDELDTVGGANLPPAGQIWFGSSFDTDTMEVRDRTTTVGATDAFSGVASLGRTVDGSDLNMRVYWNDQLVTTSSANAQGSGDTWGWSLGPVFEPGRWRYEVTDLGGNVLASGEITAE